jgi:hypothetical protein
VDLWDEALGRLAADPFDPFLCEQLLETDDPDRVARLVSSGRSGRWRSRTR